MPGQDDGLAADDQIQGLPLDDLGGFFLHLLSRQVHQQVGYEEHRVVIILSDVHLNRGASWRSWRA